MALEQLPRLTSQTSLVERVKYQISVGTPLVFVTGAFESGKTVFSEQLISSMDDEAFVCAFVPCQEKLSLEKLREILLKQLSANIVFNASDRLLGTIQRMGFGSKRVLIVADDIDKAPQDFFDDLVQVYRTYVQQNLFSVVVTSSQAWSDSEARKVKKEGMMPVEMEIQPLTLPESLTMISYYRRFYGMAPLSDRDLKGFYDINSCGTNPGEIRKIVEAVSKGLKPGDSLPKDKVQPAEGEPSSRKKDIIIGAVAVALLAGGIGFYAMNKINYSDPKVNTALTGPDEPANPVIDSHETLRLGPELNHQRTDLSPVVVVNNRDDSDGTTVIIQDDAGGQVDAGSSDDGTESIVLITDDGDPDSNGDRDLVITENTISKADRQAEGDLAPSMSSGTEKDGTLAGDSKKSDATNLIAVNTPVSDKTDTAPSLPKSDNANPPKSNAANNVKKPDTVPAGKDSGTGNAKKDNAGKDTVSKNSDTKPPVSPKSASDSSNKTDSASGKKPQDNSSGTGKDPLVLNGGKHGTSGNTRDNPEKKPEPKPDPKPVQPLPKSPDVDFSTLSGKHYTLQLIASNKAGAERLKKRLKGGWVLFRPERNDYIVVYGDFATKAEADAAKSRFPADVRANKPWSKPVSQVQNESSH